jgi:hypothetical protein
MVDQLILGGYLVWKFPPSSAVLGHLFVSNQQTQTGRDIWDGQQIRGTFRRTFTEEMMVQW